ncbi:MAG: TIGR03016 family PEP-CTERM system-associated outer membrane protein [Gammaproteobacteria bacterium]|nr:TIGR03016 family PEP-CTERM system-associated outer membrane protein [Gammaproteobacteria bacterium]MBU2435821.1 TIGR03016 family PEP-CTERM system-associated outer membrane protein [Gammaproteobacteria bacterium]MBU2449398.1 TIGR03016 family PEP-CTERM system-associated outer membrane protein [Gammaproteobacteria bacterium]
MRNSTFFLKSAYGLTIVCLATNTALAQNSGVTTQGRTFSITPRISLTETWSDNLAVSRSQNNKESGFLTQLSPGIRIDAKTARLKTYFDYALVGNFYSASSVNSRTQNSLNTFGTFEAISNWLFLDFSGRIAQQAISAFGPQSPSSGSYNTNSTETSNYRLSPYIRGHLAGLVDYSLRYTWSTTQSNASALSNVDLSDWAGQLRGGTPFQSLKWSVDASQQTADYSSGRATDAERLYATATYSVVPQFRISLSGGQESNNYASLNKESHPTHGYGFDWNPTERTQISAFKERRFFGDGHRYSLSHRFPLSSIRYSDSKDVSVLPNQFTSVGLGTVFDLFQQICSQQLSSSYTDPNQLEQAANTCAATLVSQAGISPDTLVTSSFLSSRATVQRRQQLALALQGTRNTLTVLFNRNESRSVLAAAATNDDFNLNNINNIRQRGVSVTLSHRLSGLSNLNLTASRQESTGTGNATLKSTTTLYQANLTTKLGAKATGGISVRHSEFESTTSPYTENALVGTLSIVF